MDPARISLEDDRHGLTGMAFRFGNRATYLGASGDDHQWAIAILIGPDDEIQTVSIDESGAKTSQILPSGELFDALEILAGDGPPAFSIAAALALTGLELRGADARRAHEFAALLRRAAADRGWPLPIRLAGEDRELHLSDQGRGILRHLAEMLERDSRAMTTMPAARRLELAESALDGLRKRIQRQDLQAYRVQGRWYAVLDNLIQVQEPEPEPAQGEAREDDTTPAMAAPTSEAAPVEPTPEREPELAVDEERTKPSEDMASPRQTLEDVVLIAEQAAPAEVAASAGIVAGTDEDIEVEADEGIPPVVDGEIEPPAVEQDMAGEPPVPDMAEPRERLEAEAREAEPLVEQTALDAPDEREQAEPTAAEAVPSPAAGGELAEEGVEPQVADFSEEELAAAIGMMGQQSEPSTARLEGTGTDSLPPAVELDGEAADEPASPRWAQEGATEAEPAEAEPIAEFAPAAPDEESAPAATSPRVADSESEEAPGVEAIPDVEAGPELDIPGDEQEDETELDTAPSPTRHVSAPPAPELSSVAADPSLINYLRDEVVFLRGQLAEKDRQMMAWIEEGKRKDLMISRLESRVLDMPGLGDLGDDVEAARLQARQQLEAVRDEWLQPFVDQIRSLENDVGRLEAERSDRQASTLAEIRQERDALRERIDELESEIRTLRASAPDQQNPHERRPWYRRLFGFGE